MRLRQLIYKCASDRVMQMIQAIDSPRLRDRRGHKSVRSLKPDCPPQGSSPDVCSTEGPERAAQVRMSIFSSPAGVCSFSQGPAQCSVAAVSADDYTPHASRPSLAAQGRLTSLPGVHWPTSSLPQRYIPHAMVRDRTGVNDTDMHAAPLFGQNGNPLRAS